MICNAEEIANYMEGYIATLPSTTSVSGQILASTSTAYSPKPGPSQEYATPTKKAQKRPSQQCYFPSKKMPKKAGNINLTEEMAMLLKDERRSGRIPD